jgi:hypothetical protein
MALTAAAKAQPRGFPTANNDAATVAVAAAAAAAVVVATAAAWNRCHVSRLYAG